MPNQTFRSRLKNGEHIIMDGALGTELERRGANIDHRAWSAWAVKDSPDLIKDIHLDYLKAGAQLHIVNSFALAKHVLEPVDLVDNFEYLNRRAVEIFLNALEQSGKDRSTVWIAGSLSTFAANSDRSLLPSPQILRENYQQQAKILLDAGADLLALEMLYDVNTSVVMLDAVRDYGVPVIAGFTCEWGEVEGERVVCGRGMDGVTRQLKDILPAFIDNVGNSDIILSIMHSDFDVTDAALTILRRHWQGPVATYPNSGEFVKLRMQFGTVIDKADFQKAAERWKNEGVQIIGGCCGLGPDHISALNYVPDTDRNPK